MSGPGLRPVVLPRRGRLAESYCMYGEAQSAAAGRPARTTNEKVTSDSSADQYLRKSSDPVRDCQQQNTMIYSNSDHESSHCFEMYKVCEGTLFILTFRRVTQCAAWLDQSPTKTDPIYDKPRLVV